jgi:hypothetical protein
MNLEPLMAAAIEVLRAYDHWGSRHNEDGHGPVNLPRVELKFNTQAHADRGEQLLWAIVASTGQEFRDNFRHLLSGDLYEINLLVDYAEELGQRLSMRSAELNVQKSFQQRITQKRTEYFDLIIAFQGQKDCQAWSDVPNTVIAIQRLMADCEILKNEASDFATRSAQFPATPLCWSMMPL